jgi:hypothetical protein
VAVVEAVEVAVAEAVEVAEAAADECSPKPPMARLDEHSTIWPL